MPAKETPMRYTPIRYAHPVRCAAHEIYTSEMHALKYMPL
jgi:hypothetical protein